MTTKSFKRGREDVRKARARDLYRSLVALDVGDSLVLPTGVKVTSAPASRGGGVATERGESFCPWHLATGLYGVDSF